jgi:hypothetical protein
MQRARISKSSLPTKQHKKDLFLILFVINLNKNNFAT